MRTCGVESGSCSSCGQLDMAKEHVKCDVKNLTKKASLRDTSRCKQGNGTFVEMIMIEFKTRPAGVSHWSIVLHCRILLHPNERLHLFGSVIQDSAKVNLVRILSYKHSNPTNGFRMGQGIPRVPVIFSNCCTTIWCFSDFHGCSDESKPPKPIFIYIYIHICYMSTCMYGYIQYMYIHMYIMYIHNTYIHIISSLCWHRSTTSMSSWGQDQFDVWPNHLGHTIPTERSRHLSERNKKWVKQKKAKKEDNHFFLPEKTKLKIWSPEMFLRTSLWIYSFSSSKVTLVFLTQCTQQKKCTAGIWTPPPTFPTRSTMLTAGCSSYWMAIP